MSAPERRTGLTLHRELQQVWGSGSGLARLAAVNHTVVGLRFMVTALVFFAIGGILAMMIRAQIATSRSAFVDADQYAQFFTMHGTVMMFLFAIPMLEGFALYMLPKLLGARDMAFPRLSAFGYWCYLFGGTILIVAMLAGLAPDSGWFMYTPLSSRVHSPGINADVWLLGVTFVEVSAICAAVEFMTSILKLRAPGMSLDRMPILGWYLLVTAGMMLLGFPPLILGSILLEIERAFDLPFFDPTRGGDPLLWQHLFWLFGHPEVYIIFLPAAGAISMMVPVFARHELVGYREIVVAIVALAFLSFGLWVHHMFTVGIPHVALAFFSAASGLVAIPTAVQIFAWMATLAKGRPRLDVPMLYLGGFFVVFVMGGLTGVMLALVPFNWQAHDSQFVVAHLHYVLVGGFVFPMLAAIQYWLPHVTGRRSNLKLSVPAFWLIFGGFNMTFFLMHLTGLKGMPRRMATYPPEAQWDLLNLLSSVGGFIMAFGFALFLIDMVMQVRFGCRVGRDPWRATTLEWAMPTPPTAYGFASLPHVEDRGDRFEPRQVGAMLARGEGYLPGAPRGRMETLGVEPATGRLTQLIVLPGPSFLPLWTALALGCFVLALLLKLYWWSLGPAALVLILALAWTRGTGAREDCGLLEVGRGEAAVPHWEAEEPPSVWAMRFTLIANGAFLASLVFSYFFLAVSAPGWPPPTPDLVPAWLTGLALATALAAALAARTAVATTRAGGKPTALLAVGLAAQTATLAACAVAIAGVLPAAGGHAHAAGTFVLLAYLCFHALLGAVFMAYALRRTLSGYVSARRSLDLRLASAWQAYTAASAATVGAAILGMEVML